MTHCGISRIGNSAPVLRAGPGQYRVAVASAAGADPSESFRAIEAATGLALPGGTL